MGADYDMDATPGLEAGGFEYYTRRRRRAAARRAGRVRRREGPRLRARAALQVSAGPVRGGVPAARVLHAAGHPRLGADDVDVPDAAPGPGDRRGRRRCSATRSPRGTSRSCPQHLVTSIDPATRTAQLASGGTLPYDLFVGIPIHRAPDPLAASGLAVNGWVPVDQTNLRTQFPAGLRHRRRLHRPPHRPQGRDLRRVGRACRRRRHRGLDRRRGATGAVRRVGRLLRRVRRRARQQGRGQLPQRPGGGGAAKRRVARVRRREGGVRRDQAGALVRALIVVCARCA